jgi:chemotaxis protein CheC
MISAEQLDALTEWVNIGFGRAAGSLSELLGKRILLKAPQVVALSLPDLYSALENITTHDLVLVRQIFSGGVNGDILLFLDFDSASILIDLLCGGSGEKRRLTFSDREALMEVGNILLNAYLGSFGNLLSARINLSLPELHISALEHLTEILSVSRHHSQFILLVKTQFSLLDRSVTGYIALVIEGESLESLIGSIRESEGIG